MISIHNDVDKLMFQREQEAIQRKMLIEKRGFTWDDTRRMPMTNQVQ